MKKLTMKTAAAKKSIPKMARPEMISISGGNNKMGLIPSVSLPAVETCPSWVPCKKTCYIVKNVSRYARSALKAYTRNWTIYKADPDFYFSQIKNYNHFRFYTEMEKDEKDRILYFRYHVSGDIPDDYYWNKMKEVAEAVPGINFMVITKAYFTVDNDLPDNLSLMISGWPGLAIPNRLEGIPIIWMQDGTETRAKGAFPCSGACDECFQCWNSKRDGKNIVIQKH